MARIRTIKPDYFRHEGLQELGERAMLVFAGLWTQCDSKGRFQWRPRQLKLDILPFIEFKMEDVLESLKVAGFIHRYEVNGNSYGHIPTFHKHQRITGKEAVGGEKYPEPIVSQGGNTRETPGKQPGNDGERQDVQEKERERERNKKQIANPVPDPVDNSNPTKKDLTELFLKAKDHYPSVDQLRQIQKFIEMSGGRNIKAKIHCLRRLSEEAEKGKPVLFIGKWLEKIMKDEEPIYNARDSEEECNAHKRDFTSMQEIFRGMPK